MSTKEYFAKLEQQNGYCNCQALADVFEQKRRIKGLEGKCEMLDRNVDLEEPRLEDMDILQDYAQTDASLADAVRTYCDKLNELLSNGLLLARAHRDMNSVPSCYLSPKQAKAILEEKTAVLSVHCSNCEQQIEVIK